MGDEADGRQVLAPRRGRDSGIDIAVLIHKCIVDAQAVELLHQEIGHIEFPLGAGGTALAIIIALAVNFCIPHQAVDHGIHHCASPSSSSRFSGFRH